MAEERIENNKRIIRPRIATWNLKAQEGAFFESRAQLKNWVVADKSRRSLADVTNHLSMAMQDFPDAPFEKVERTVIQQFSVVAASSIVVRSVGAGMALISCGYLAESAGPTRRGLEARLHGRAILDDKSGDYAIRYAKGKGRGLTRLASQYGHLEDIDTLSRIAHADVRGIQRVRLGGQSRTSIADLRPRRQAPLAAMALILLANDAMGMLGVMAEAFEVEIEVAPWLAEELKQQREHFLTEAEQLNAAKTA